MVRRKVDPLSSDIHEFFSEYDFYMSYEPSISSASETTKDGQRHWQNDTARQKVPHRSYTRKQVARSKTRERSFSAYLAEFYCLEMSHNSQSRSGWCPSSSKPRKPLVRNYGFLLSCADDFTTSSSATTKVLRLKRKCGATVSSNGTNELHFTLTENGGLTYATTGDAVLDFFVDVMQCTSEPVIVHHLETAWAKDPLATLKLVFNLRNVRSGKAAKDEFFTCMKWLYSNHPDTLLANLRHIPQHGCWKDLCMLLRLLAFGADPKPAKKPKSFVQTSLFSVQDGSGCIDAKFWKFLEGFLVSLYHYSEQPAENRVTVTKGHLDKTETQLPMIAQRADSFAQVRFHAQLKRRVWKSYVKSLPQDLRPYAKTCFQDSVQKYEKQYMQQASSLRESNRKEWQGRVADLCAADLRFNRLYEAVVELFVEALMTDKQTLDQRGRLHKSALAAKWAPSPGGSHDKYLGLAKAVALKLFKATHMTAGQQSANFPAATEQQVLDYYRHQFLVPLRTDISGPERYMSAGLWHAIPYHRVPSVAMKRNSKLFVKHDEAGFTRYLQEVAAGKKKIASGALLPHDIVNSVCSLPATDPQSTVQLQVLELQWQSYVQSLKESGSLGNALAICDVSGSMSGTPMDAAVSLSLLLAELAEPPFNKLVITFSSQPQFHRVDQGKLKERLVAMKQMNWGMSTNLQAALDLVLKLAVECRLAAHKMITSLFVFTDMEFDEASGPQGMTDYQMAERKFAAAGYPMPRVVFWNLRGGLRSKAATAQQTGVAMLSGFSGQMLKLFLEKGTDAAEEAAPGSEKSPADALQDLLAQERYQQLIVVD